MRTATVRQLRHAFPEVLRWIEQGETVRISRRGKVVAVLRPPKRKPAADRKVEMPDFMARLKRMYGDKVLPAEATQAIIDENRGTY